MLALYRSGRQADSLATFQTLLAFLAEEHHMSPSDPLRRLYTDILSADRRLDLASARVWLSMDLAAPRSQH